MRKVELMEILQWAAKRFQPELLQQVRNKLDVRELKLLDYVFEKYYREDKMTGRWYDPYHILISTDFALRLAGLSPLIIPAIILHDIGYKAIPDKDTGWNTKHSRIVHMQEGAALAAGDLVRVGGLSSEEIEVIVGIVASHDNLILGIPVNNPTRLALIDADRVWVMHFISFWKDFVSEAGHPEDLSPSDLLKLRHDKFYEVNIPLTDLAKLWRGGGVLICFSEIVGKKRKNGRKVL